MDRIIIKIADYKVAKGPAILTTYGLGSCLAVVLYDPAVKVAGMGHIMLPRPDFSRAIGNPGKFADLCISGMLKELQGNGSTLDRVVAKMAGGARMFDIPYDDNFSIGMKNRKSVMEELQQRGIPLIGEDTGGSYGRTVEFHIESGDMVVMSLRNGKKVI